MAKTQTVYLENGFQLLEDLKSLCYTCDSERMFSLDTGFSPTLQKLQGEGGSRWPPHCGFLKIQNDAI